MLNIAYHGLIVYKECLIEQDITIDLLNDVVLHENQPIDLDVDSKPVGVKASTYLFVDLNENVVSWLFNRPVAVFFGH
jgi:hypothetical protein